MAQADRPAAPGQAARTGESGLAVRLQLPRAQLDPASEADGATTGNLQGAVCLNHGSGPRNELPEAAIPDRHCSNTQFEHI
jgi:hypothetical protein